MSFNLLNVEPRYDHIDEDYSWTFYKLIVVRQHLLLNGSIKYSIRIGLGYPSDVLTTNGKEPTKEELNAALLKLALDKGWYDDNEEHDIHPVQIPKNQMGIAVKELKAKYPAADGKKIADLVKANLCN